MRLPVYAISHRKVGNRAKKKTTDRRGRSNLVKRSSDMNTFECTGATSVSILGPSVCLLSACYLSSFFHYEDLFCGQIFFLNIN